MHRGVRDQLEEILAGTGDALCERHLSECEECGAEVAAMREQRALLRSLRAQAGTEPASFWEDAPEQSSGFYARVMERIEAQNVVSIWQLFFDSRVGKGLAMASMAVALCLSAYLVSEEQNSAIDDGQVMVERSHNLNGRGLKGALAAGMLTGAPDANAVLANLVTYREQ